MTARVRLGVTFPQDELSGDPLALRRFALAAEELGYDHLLLYDHVVGAVRGVPRAPTPSCGSALSSRARIAGSRHYAEERATTG